MKIKSNSVTLELKKANKKYWDDIKHKTRKAGTGSGSLLDDSSSKKAEEDPNASLMSMMKDLYDNGDENMKRTIAESWTKAQQEKGIGGGKQ